MKDFNWSLFLGCCVISIGIIFAGVIIASKMSTAFTGNLSASLTGNLSTTSATSAVSSSQFGEYLSEHEVPAFLSISDEGFGQFIDSGELDGTYTVINGSYVFSREKLSEWVKNRIDKS